MLKYVETVRRLSDNGGDFISFDQEVRYARQLKLTDWDTFQVEPYVKALARQMSRYTQGDTQRIHTPSGFCFRYHEGSYCSGCQYSHLCPTCSGNHPMQRCRSQQGGQHQPARIGFQRESFRQLPFRSNQPYRPYFRNNVPSPQSYRGPNRFSFPGYRTFRPNFSSPFQHSRPSPTSNRPHNSNNNTPSQARF